MRTPVITGKTDDEAVDFVFKGWRTDPAAQAKHNPWSELDQARQLRDLAIRKFMVKATDLSGFPENDRARQAQLMVINALIERDWGRQMIERYFDLRIPPDVWAQLAPEAKAA